MDRPIRATEAPSGEASSCGKPTAAPFSGKLGDIIMAVITEFDKKFKNGTEPSKDEIYAAVATAYKAAPAVRYGVGVKDDKGKMAFYAGPFKAIDEAKDADFPENKKCLLVKMTKHKNKIKTEVLAMWKSNRWAFKKQT
jgi:hypothetical protein